MEKEIVVDPQTEAMQEPELSKEEQYDQWVQLATSDIFSKAVYFDKTVKDLLNAIATKTIKSSKVNE